MYVLKTFITKKVLLSDESEAIKTTFEKLWFCNNKKELKESLKFLLNSNSCLFGKNELYTCIQESCNLNVIYANGAIIYNTNNKKGKIQEFKESEFRFNLGIWKTKDAINKILNS